MPKILIVNLNLDPREMGGCLGIDKALRQLAPDVEIASLPFAQVRADPHGSFARVDGLILGPQGTPFGAYDPAFLPWLRSVCEVFEGPILGICGGMQALALAQGGKIAPAFGQLSGADYAGMRKVSGPLAIALDDAALPAWLPADLGARWREEGGRAQQNHVEQVTVLPPPWRVIASSAPTPVEAFAHPTLPILASQFHPERGWQEGCGAGRAWLLAWLRLVLEAA